MFVCFIAIDTPLKKGLSEPHNPDDIMNVACCHSDALTVSSYMDDSFSHPSGLSSWQQVLGNVEEAAKVLPSDRGAGVISHLHK